MKKLLCSIATLILLAGQASAAPISVSQWTDLVVGDKTYTKIANSANINGSDVEAVFANPTYSLNLSNLSTVTTNFTLDYSIAISGPLFFNLVRTSQNDILGNTTAGSTVEVFSDAFATLLFSDNLIQTDAAPAHFFAGNLNKIWVRYTSTGVDGSNSLSNMTTDVTQRERLTAVPEPSSLVLCGLAAVGLVVARRRFKA